MDWNMLYYPMNGQIVNAKGLMSITWSMQLVQIQAPAESQYEP